ncbi:MAG: hypothetical protein E7206_02635 [Clostridium beijerinckii]|nr:hypothetical protein [Clostridium beijerinckii]
MSSIQRITGTNSGLDVDTLVKTALKGDQSKIDKEVQNKKVMEYQQEQYRTIMSSGSDFYDKYLDILKTGSMVSSGTYQTQTYTSSNSDKVTAKGLAGAKLDNYTIDVKQLAQKATDSFDLDSETGTGKKIKIGLSEITFDVVADGNTTVSNYNAAIVAKKKEYTNVINGTDGVATDADKKIAQQALDELNNNIVNATYSQFTNSVTFTASAFGGTGFTLSGHSQVTDKYLQATIKNSNGDVYEIKDSDKKTENAVTVDNVQFTFKGVTNSTTTNNKYVTTSSISSLFGDNIAKISKTTETEYTLNDVNNSMIKILDDGTIKVTKADGITPIDTPINFIGADGTKTTVNTDGTLTIDSPTMNKAITSSSINLLGDYITGIDTTDPNKTKYKLKDSSIITISNDGTTTITKADGITPIDTPIDFIGADGTKTTVNTNGTLTIDSPAITKNITSTSINLLENYFAKVAESNKTEYTLTDNSKITIADDGTTTIQKYDTTTNKLITLTGTDTMDFKTSDGTEMTIKADGSLTTSADTSVKLTGATDITSLKDTIVKFVDDYNTLLSSMNTKLFETRDKDYMPLTDEQKSAMTDSQVTAWEKKAQTGLLRKDSDLERIVSEMKSAMSTVISGSGLSLEKIGISPVKDYTSKNGMLTVDEDKLTKALENNAGDVKDLFMRASTPTDPGGAMTQLKSVLNDEFKKSTSSLSKKAGLVGSSTESDNTLTNNIYKKKTLISELNSKLSDKENALYKKYSNLETAMENLNAQKSSLASMLGTS